MPSEFNRDAFVSGGVAAGRVHTLPHGLEFAKFNLSIGPLEDPALTRKGFRILFNGGLLPRKGIDLLLLAYLKVTGVHPAVLGAAPRMHAGTIRC